MVNESKYDNENELSFLHWAASSRKKRRKCNPEDGQLLGTFTRDKSHRTQYSWTAANGHPHMKVQDFQLDERDGSWFPVEGPCITVRIHQLEEALRVHENAIHLAASPMDVDDEVKAAQGENVK